VTTQKANDPAAVLAVILGALAMACSPIMQRLADVGPFASAFWRVALAIPALLIWTKIHEHGRLPARQLPRTSVLAGVMFAGDLFFWHLSVSQTSVANATFFATSAPVWVVIIGFVLWRSKVQSNVVLGLALCLTGGAALVWQTLSINPNHLIGDINGTITGMFSGPISCVLRRRGAMARRRGSR